MPQTPLCRDSVELYCDCNIMSNDVRADLDYLRSLTSKKSMIYTVKSITRLYAGFLREELATVKAREADGLQELDLLHANAPGMITSLKRNMYKRSSMQFLVRHIAHPSNR